MSGIRVFVLLALTLSGCLCDVSTAKDTKRAVKADDYTGKKIEKKSTNEKRESSGLTAIYGIKSKDEPFRPLYQYQYQPTQLGHSAARYVTAGTSPQVTYSKPENVIRVADSREGGGNLSPSNNEVIQYGPSNSYKSDGGVIYSPTNYKASGSSGGAGQYASSAYRGPYVSNYQPGSVNVMKMQSASLYAPPPPAGQPPATVALPLHYGGFEQHLPPQYHQQNQYAIAFPAEYLRHYQQNIPAPFPLHGAHSAPFVFAAPPPQPLPPLKDQAFKQSAVHYILASPPPSPQSAPAPSSPAASGPTVVTHFIPLYGPGSQQHQQFQQHSPRALYFGGHHQQALGTTFAYAPFPPQQQSIQIVPKNQIIGPIQMAAIGAGAAAATVPFIPFKPILAGQQLQQSLQHFHQHHHPGATSYARYSQGLSDGNSIPSAGGDSNPIEGPASETSSSSSTLKLSPLYSAPSSQSSGSLYAGSTGAAGGKMSYTYASDANSVGPVFTHPGAIQYGTHLYQAPSKVIEIGSNRVTAGSAVIAGVAPPAYHPQQKSAVGNSHGRSGAAGGGGTSSPVVKYS